MIKNYLKHLFYIENHTITVKGSVCLFLSLMMSLLLSANSPLSTKKVNTLLKSSALAKTPGNSQKNQRAFGKGIRPLNKQQTPPQSLPKKQSKATDSVIQNQSKPIRPIGQAIPNFRPLTIPQAKKIKGRITDEHGQGLQEVVVRVKGSSLETLTDAEGNFSIETQNPKQILVISHPGYITVETTLSGYDFVAIILEVSEPQPEDVPLHKPLDFATVGSRNTHKHSTQNHLPITIVDITKLATYGPQTTVNEILNYALPLFTSQPQTAAGGTDHIDPISLKGLGPDQVLVLINGKRRHTSSLIHVEGTVGTGSAGTDMNAIPVASIQRIEILRDDASAQYGSGATAGVINIVLKEATGKLDITIMGGGNVSKNSNRFSGGSDGEKAQLNLNYGLPLGEKGGFINLTGSLSMRNPAWRNNNFTNNIFQGYHGAERLFAENGGNIAAMSLSDYASASQGLSYLSQNVKDEIAALDLDDPDDQQSLIELLFFDADSDELQARGLTRADFGFNVGAAKVSEGQFFTNMSFRLGETTHFYGFGGISARNGLAYGEYRRPAQLNGRANTSLYPNGFLPSIHSNILDKSLAVGIKSIIKGWHIDLSNTYGQNTFSISVENSSNSSLESATPTKFDAGGFGFSQNTLNLDISKSIERVFKGLNIAFGAAYNVESYEINAGDEASYTRYDDDGNPITNSIPEQFARANFTGTFLRGGSQGYRGFNPKNAINESRNNLSAYVDIEADLTKKWFLSIAGRNEDYSDSGGLFNYKITSRYSFSNKFLIRASTGSGFRAPSLHQRFYAKNVPVFLNDQVLDGGVFNNESEIAGLLGFEKLKNEQSNSISAGISGTLGTITYAIDAYQTTVDNRIILTDNIRNNINAELSEKFEVANVWNANFFSNALDTKSTGLDILLSHKSRVNDSIHLTNHFGAAFYKTTVTRTMVPELIQNADRSIAFFNGRNETFLTLAQPRTKLNFTNEISFNHWHIMLRNVFFGEVVDPDAFSGDETARISTVEDNAIYGGKIVTDLSVSKSFGKRFLMTLGANNLFDTYPTENGLDTTNGNQYVFSRRTSQFGYSGRFLFARMTYSL